MSNHRAAFSTRFLPSDGIPEYNALLDTHLGKRRDFLLGNKGSLQLLQQTGVIERVEPRRDDARGYVVYMPDRHATRKRAHTRRRQQQQQQPPPSTPTTHELYGTTFELDPPASHGMAPWNIHRSESMPILFGQPQPLAATAIAMTTVTADARDEDLLQAELDDRSLAADAERHDGRVDPGGRTSSGGEDSITSLPLRVPAKSRTVPLKGMGRSASTTALFGRSSGSNLLGALRVDDPSTPGSAVTAGTSLTEPSPTGLIDHLRRRRASHVEALELKKRAETTAAVGPELSRPGTATGVQGRRQPPTTPTSALLTSSPSTGKGRTTVERLLESDAAYQVKIEVLRGELRGLDAEKATIDDQISTLRRRLRGVNAVQENDLAVAHCSSIMQHRLAKAEEEYMKLVTAQQQVKTEIDTLRRELLAMRKVQRRLESDIEDVVAGNAAMDDKIRASKAIRNLLSEELVELERRAELESEEQRLKLPPEEDVIVDAEELMGAVQRRHAARSARRRSSVVLTDGSPLANLQRMLSDRSVGDAGPNASTAVATMTTATTADKPLLSFSSAFRVLQQTLGCADVMSFVEQFEATEEQLLSQHKVTLQLDEELAQLEKEAMQLRQDNYRRHAAIRGSQQEHVAVQHELQAKIQVTMARIASFDELRELRNHEHTRLRGIMQRCLEILHAEQLVSRQEVSELSSPALLEALQNKMTEVAVTLKLRQQHGGHGDENAAGTGHGHGELGGEGTGARAIPKTGKLGRRSNLLAKRNEATTRIVLGPREPTGAALSAILLTAQPPSVDGAQVLAETHAAALHQLHPEVIPAPAVVSSPPAGGKAKKLTIARAASIRAGKRSTLAAMGGGSSRRLLTTATTATASTTSPPTNSRPHARASLAVVPMGRLALQHGSTSSLIGPEDALAEVVENPDDLDS